MRRLIIALAFVAAVAVGLTGCGSTDEVHHHHHHGDCSACATHASDGGWCQSCKVGYVDGDPVTCRSCYVASHRGGTCVVHGR